MGFGFLAPKDYLRWYKTFNRFKELSPCSVWYPLNYMTFQSLTLKVIPETRHAHLIRYLRLITKQQTFTKRVLSKAMLYVNENTGQKYLICCIMSKMERLINNLT